MNNDAPFEGENDIGALKMRGTFVIFFFFCNTLVAIDFSLLLLLKLTVLIFSASFSLIEFSLQLLLLFIIHLFPCCYCF